MNALVSWLFGEKQDFHLRLENVNRQTRALIEDTSEILEDCNEAEVTVNAEIRLLEQERTTIQSAQFNATDLIARLRSIAN